MARFLRERYPRAVRATPAGRWLIARLAAQTAQTAMQDRVIAQQRRLIDVLRRLQNAL